MRIARRLTSAFNVTLPPEGLERNLPSHLAGLLWYMEVMLVGASVGTFGALVYSLAL